LTMGPVNLYSGRGQQEPQGQEDTMEAKIVKVTVEMPESLLKAAKIQAVKEDTTLRELVIQGLEARLKRGGR
jgi:hypothetical protein